MRKLLTFFKTQNPRRAGQGSAGGWLEASGEAARCQPKDPQNSSAVSSFLQAYSLSKSFVLCTTLVLATLASIANAVCSPASAQCFNEGGQNLGLGPFIPPTYIGPCDISHLCGVLFGCRMCAGRIFRKYDRRC
jgi:hypothetical protein